MHEIKNDEMRKKNKFPIDKKNKHKNQTNNQIKNKMKFLCA